MLKQELETTEEEPMPSLILPTETEATASDAAVIETEAPLVASVRKRLERMRRSLRAVILISSMGGLASYILGDLLRESGSITYAASVGIGLYIAIGSILFYHSKLLASGKKDIQKVAELLDVQAVGALIEILSLEKKIIAADAQQSLIALLPRLRPEDANLLNNRHRATLRRILSTNTELVLNRDVSRLFTPASLSDAVDRRAIELRVAIMEALANIGTQEDIAVVERLAKIEPKSEAQTVLKSTAERCLPLLQDRAAALSDKNTLLRASSADADSADILLRTASAAHPEPANELLRPTLGE